MPVINDDGQRFVCYLSNNFSTQTQEIKRCVMSSNPPTQSGLRDNGNNLLVSSDGFYLQIAVKYLIDSQSNTLLTSTNENLITA